MPVQDIVANALACEKLLTEDSGLMSAIRIADVFYYTPAPPELNLPLKHQAIPIALFAAGRVPIHDTSNHRIEIKLVRPDGDVKSLGVLHDGPILPKIEGLPAGFNLNVQATVIPEQMGFHYFSVLIDDVEVARASFTLVRREAPLLP